jgi:hypothetical protein
MRRVGIVVGFGIAMVGFAACGVGADDIDAPNSPVARYHWDQKSAMDALAVGTLLLKDGCLTLGSDDGESTRGVLVFPRELASWDNATQVLTYSGRQLHMGDAISAGGGFPGVFVGDIPAACRALYSSPDDYFLIQDEAIAP